MLLDGIVKYHQDNLGLKSQKIDVPEVILRLFMLDGSNAEKKKPKNKKHPPTKRLELEMSERKNNRDVEF